MKADLYNKTGAHDDQQVAGGKVCAHTVLEPVWQALPKEDYIRLDECAARLAQRNIVGKDNLLHPLLAVFLQGKL